MSWMKDQKTSQCQTIILLDFNFWYDSVPILSAYFVIIILQSHLSLSLWCAQLDIPNEKIFVKSGMWKRKSVKSQRDGKRGKITSLFVMREHTEIGMFMLGL